MTRPQTVASFFDLSPQKLGSFEEYAGALSSALRERGWCSVLAFVRPPPDAVCALFDEAGAVVEVLRTQGRTQQFEDIWRLLRKHRPAIAHFHFFEHFSLLPIVARLAGAKAVFFTDHFRQPQPIRARTRLLCRLWDRVVFPLCRTRVLAVSEHIKRTLVDCYQMRADRVSVLRNGINTRRFVPQPKEAAADLRAELRIPPGVPVVVSASNLRPEKGLDDLLVCAKQVLAARPETVFVIVGDGREASRLRELAQKLGIAEQVRFTGMRSDVQRFMVLADVVVMPSTWQEPAGLVPVEAMAAARPVVATRVGGIPEYCPDGEAGILVEPRAPSQLAQALLRLLCSPEEAARMGRAGRGHAESRASMDRWVQETLWIYGHSAGAALEIATRP
jgi:glycosyltransferase involved in cell wall biosynthesis